ncbi:hypothetical protein [Nocardioides coralli]|uniref:hypothetical protein n=1 Tax=Nocardioides coralli TaxID=2872154 RepID=UPI001CA45B3C|nr:hypothetical protein [Nocardioides coralli]QZY28301.1 hypothetical protein K6T13_12545 [Nocardioides coralli]
MSAPLIRRAALVTVAATVPLLAATPAVADVPEGWSDPAEVGLLDLLIVVVGLPVLVGLLIVLAVYVPAMARGERVAPGEAETPDQWFGGPRSGASELESGREVGSTGGASGSW